MRITEALTILQRAPKEGTPFHAVLACGFTPLHLQTFLGAYLQQAHEARHVTIQTGPYGDLAGTLEKVSDSQAHGVAMALEWPDLDARLGYRSSGNWGPGALADIVMVARASLERIAKAIENIPAGIPVAICMPSLTLPPVFHTAGWQTADAELTLQQLNIEFASRVAKRRGVSIANAGRLAERSSPASRFDLKSDLLAGLPYTVAHADAVAYGLARLLAPPAPKKGLITDLDDTLWSGLVGEIGPENVSWDLANRTQVHGLYQRLLSALSQEGILIGIASKNDPEIVRRALERRDLLLDAERIFPVEVNWNAKSGSVQRILQTWNIGADAVVFVDDSRLELAEVAAAYPEITCVHFPMDDYAGCQAMLNGLRDLFGRERLGSEDTIRLESIRQRAVIREATESAADPESFLKQAGAIVTFDFNADAANPRVLELVNKTNQFNLNGVRHVPADWSLRHSRPGAVLLSVNYQDKFGPLGTIAVVRGWRQGSMLNVDTWVMSCRAFSRRVEHQCLKMLLDHYGAEGIIFEFQSTAKNGPLQDFFASIIGSKPAGPFTLIRAQFDQHCPPLYHQVTESIIPSNQWTAPQSA